jgi:hypothetical protein
LIAKNRVIDGVILLLLNERPNLVNLDVRGIEVAKPRIQEGRAMMPGAANHIQHRAIAHARQASRGPDAHALAEQVNDLLSFGRIKPRFTERLDLGECFPATGATVTLDDAVFVLEVAETLGFALTTIARSHFGLAFRRPIPYVVTVSYRICSP